MLTENAAITVTGLANTVITDTENWREREAHTVITDTKTGEKERHTNSGAHSASDT